MDPVTKYFYLIAAGLGAGLMNAVAGGGSFLTFPALVWSGIPSVIANASSTVALFPASFASAWAYRREAERLNKLALGPAVAASIAGGIAGAILLLYTPERVFDSVVPWILLIATVTLAVGPRVSGAANGRFEIGSGSLILLQFIVGIYGGYFGGAVGIMMLAAWSIAGVGDIHAMNAGKTLLAGTMNAAAVICFMIAGKIWWPGTLAMLSGAVVGGYAGARLAKRLAPQVLRPVVIAICVVVTVAFFIR